MGLGCVPSGGVTVTVHGRAISNRITAGYLRAIFLVHTRHTRRFIDGEVQIYATNCHTYTYGFTLRMHVRGPMQFSCGGGGTHSS